jgi:hypothetical protein
VGTNYATDFPSVALCPLAVSISKNLGLHAKTLQHERIVAFAKRSRTLAVSQPCGYFARNRFRYAATIVIGLEER